jgi:murein DD-endopeptidase MepM/ murein hydrolase activator NlpD
MPQFDPRREPVRFAPSLGAITLAICAAGMMTSAHGETSKAGKVRHAAVIPVSAPVASTPSAPLPPPPPVYGSPETLPVKLRSGETLEAAVIRAGVLPQEAAKAAQMIRANFDPSELEPGFRFETSVSSLRGQERAGKLIALEMRPTPARVISLARTPADDFQLTDEEEQIVEEAGVVEGEIRGSLYTSAKKAGVGGTTLKEIVKVFASKLDFERDIKAGNRFRLVFDQTRTESGKVIETGDLLYAEVETKGKATRFYRFERPDGRVEWLDEGAQTVKTHLLRSPVDGARMSSGFGMRRHPILGYHKMHQGVDFAAGTGTPVMAAGDGTVVEIRRWGGYGNWLRIRHASGYESGYAHLSKYASGLRVGQKVRQGEVVAYVGSTGRSTGPHLHHEIWLKGARVDPKGAKIPSGTGLDGKELAAFRSQKKKVDAALKGYETQFAGQKKGGTGLRPAQKA